MIDANRPAPQKKNEPATPWWSDPLIHIKTEDTLHHV